MRIRIFLLKKSFKVGSCNLYGIVLIIMSIEIMMIMIMYESSKGSGRKVLRELKRKTRTSDL